jgi:hypothetical protein
MTHGSGSLPPDLARMIDQARRGAPEPTEALREAVRARVSGTIGGAGAAGGAGSGALTGTALKAGLVLALAVGAGWVVWRAGDAPSPAPSPELTAERAAALAPEPRELRIAVEPHRAPEPRPERPRAAMPAPAEPEDTLAVEEALLEQARSELAIAPTAALRQLDIHADRFPNGQLAEERDLLRVRAHVAAGDDAAARAAARAFLEAHPHSIHRTEVDSLRSDP